MAYQPSQNQTYYPQQQTSYPQYSQEGYGDITNYSRQNTSYTHDTPYNASSYSPPRSGYSPPASNTQNPYDTPFDDPPYQYSTPYPEDYASTVHLHNGGEDNRDSPVPSKPSDYGGRESGLYSKEYGGSVPLDRGKKKYKFMSGLCCCKGCGKWCAGICCVIFLIIMALVITVLVLGKKPTVQFLGTTASPDGKAAYVDKGTALDFNLGLRFNVINPNIIGATFSRIQATAFYPGHSNAIGGGFLNNVQIKAKGNTTLNFPFSINYNSTQDPNLDIINDIIKKCGLTGSKPQPIKIDYTLKLSLKVLAIPFTISSNRDTDIDCPIQNGKIPAIPGLDIGSLGNIGQKLKF